MSQGMFAVWCTSHPNTETVAQWLRLLAWLLDHQRRLNPLYFSIKTDWDMRRKEFHYTAHVYMTTATFSSGKYQLSSVSTPPATTEQQNSMLEDESVFFFSP